jgi:sulfonate dioxygenase
MSLTSTITEVAQSIAPSTTKDTDKTEEPYRYAHLLPYFSKEKYPPLTPFTHIDAGSRALNHPNPRAFLDKAEVIELTPTFGSDIRGVNLAELDPDAKDELALEVRLIIVTPLSPINCYHLGRSKRCHSV